MPHREFDARLAEWRRPRHVVFGIVDAALLSLALFFVLGQAAQQSVGHYDQGFAMTNAARLLDGDVPHRDFWTVYPPGNSVVLAAAFAVAGASVEVARFVHAVWGLIFVAALWFLTRGLASRWLARAATLLGALWFSAGLYPTYSAANGLAALLACAAALGHGLRTGSTHWVTVAGAGGAVLLWLRHDFAAYWWAASMTVAALAAMGARAGRSERRPVQAAATLGSALLFRHLLTLTVSSSIALAGWVLWAGWEAFVSQALVAPATVLQAYRRLPVPALLDPMGVWLPLWLGAWSVPLALAVSAPAALAALRMSQQPDRAVAAVLWLTAAFLTQQSFSRLDVAHVAPSAIVALAAVTALASARSAGATAEGAGLLLATVTTKAVAGRRLTCALAFAMLGASTLVVLRSELSPSAIAGCLFSPMQPSCRSIRADQLEAARYVRSVTDAREPVFVGNTRHDLLWTNDALMYFLIGRPVPVLWNEMHPGIANTAAAQQAIVEALWRAKVRVVVLADMPLSTEPNLSAQSNGVALLDLHLDRHYRDVVAIGRYRILERIGDS